ncbi:hypothetical protein BLIJ_1062 [Bifidobacterium longum subsp. infantis ATCC 15697 = JCM 1222 = DSM 20088]|nr:hypothetical protein BLIJ_1062 [Bifidobacterium longum subsp. infantis ATCC 15697 = JCM 1222 = DSM 20088]
MDSFGIPLIAISAAFADVIGTSPKTSAKENETTRASIPRADFIRRAIDASDASLPW